MRASRALILLLLVGGGALAAAPAASAAVARALVDVDLIDATTEQRAKQMAEIGGQLGAKYVRLEVQWPRLEPQQGVYDETYLSSVEELVDLANANGIKVVITFVYTPRWASDSSLWDDPPNYLFPKGAYQPFYVPRSGAVDDFGAMAGTVAARLRGRVFAYEAWNEPNLWVFFYPQQKVTGDDFAVKRHAQLLAACSVAIKAADPDALVIGGATAPIGEGDASNFSKFRTRPAYWARALKALGADKHFDAYSHHPYSPGPRVLAPEALPTVPETTVGLRNLDDLLSVYPRKPFYLTEYGYNTAPSKMFGVQTGVSQATQADYLKRAYRYAARYEQVKALFWYLRRDQSPSGTARDPNGVYTGLRTVTDARKRSWYTFAGGMKLTLTAQSPIRSGRYSKLTGTLTCSRLKTATSNGGVSGKALEVQRKVNGVWKKVKAGKSGSGGRYTVWVRLYRDTRVRVVWRGVVASPSRFVDVR